MGDNHRVALTIRHMQPCDLPLVLGWVASESDLVTWAGTAFHWPLDLEQLRGALDHDAESGRTWWTAVQDDGLPVGCASVIVNDDATIGRYGRVLLNPLKRAKGYGLELVCRTVGAAFDETGVDLLNLGVFSNNRAARALYATLGFHETGLVFDVEVDHRQFQLIEMECPRHDFPGVGVCPGRDAPAAPPIP